MKKSIEIERLKKIDFLKLFQVQEYNWIEVNNDNGKSRQILTYSIKLNGKIFMKYSGVDYFHYRKAIKRAYANLQRTMEEFRYSFHYEEGAKKIENYLLMKKLEIKLREKKDRTKGVKI